MKVCTVCKIDKEMVEFFVKSNGKISSECKTCHRLYVQQHYKNNKKYYLNKAAKRNNKSRIQNRINLQEYFKDKSCKDCGITDSIVFQFDHVIGRKKNNIGSLMSGYTWPTILREIKKCEIVCANCHQRRTFKRMKCHRV